MSSAALPDGWRWVRIGDVAAVNPRPSLPDPPPSAPVSFVPMAAVEEETGRLDPTTARPFGELRGTSYRRFEEGDVVVAKITPSMENGKAAVAERLVGGQAFGTTELHVLRVSPDLDGRFLLHFLLQRTFRAEAARHMTGTAGQLRVPADYLRDSLIPLPPFVEQQRIVDAIEAHLSRLDAGGAALEQAQDRLTRLLAASMPRLFDPAWPTKPLGEIAEVVGGVTKDAKREAGEGLVEVPYLRVANVQRGHLDLTKVRTVRVLPEVAARLRLQPGDVLLTEGGDRDKLGRGCVWDGRIDPCIHQNHIFRARLLSAEYEPRFVSIHANELGRNWFEGMGKQTTNLASISLSALKRFPVPVPPHEVQLAVLSEIDRLSTFEQALRSAIEGASRCGASLRQSVLAAAFSGRLVGPNFPATVGPEVGA